MMKGIRCSVIGDPLKSVAIANDIKVPIITESDHVLVKIHYAAINPFDWMQISGQMGLMTYKTPFIPGCDFSGRVVAKGKDVKHIKINDLVYGATKSKQGTMAEFTLVKAANICKIPSNIGTLEAAAIPWVSTTSYQVLTKSGLKKGETLLILGGSTATGLAATQIAKNQIGCSNVTVTSTQQELCKSVGVDVVINYKNEKWQNVLKDKKFDVVYDCVGGLDSWDDVRSENVIKSDGYYLSIVGDKMYGSELDASALFSMTASIVNRKFWGSVGQQKYDFVMMDDSKSMSEVNQLVESGKLKAVIDQDSPYQFDDFLNMFEKSMAHKARGKLVLEICAEDNDW
eukprot:UN00062